VLLAEALASTRVNSLAAIRLSILPHAAGLRSIRLGRKV